jgi:hypothetical protein
MMLRYVFGRWYRLFVVVRTVVTYTGIRSVHVWNSNWGHRDLNSKRTAISLHPRHYSLVCAFSSCSNFLPWIELYPSLRAMNWYYLKSSQVLKASLLSVNLYTCLPWQRAVERAGYIIRWSGDASLNFWTLQLISSPRVKGRTSMQGKIRLRKTKLRGLSLFFVQKIW